jgi:molecular chaperone DnaK
MSKIIGIDLGTTNSVVAIMEGNEIKVLTCPTGTRTVPSVVGFKEDGERVVGQPAKNQAITNPENTVFSIKRFMGRRRSEVTSEEKLVPYKVIGEGEEAVGVDIRGKKFTPPEISAMVLRYLKDYAEDYLGEKVTDAVITVPAYFGDAQRQATKDAGEIAGLRVRRILNEPTAAAMAYGLDKKKDEKVLIYDLGGGTFDVSVLEVSYEEKTGHMVEVKATNGDTHLGGDDYDQVLIDYISDEFAKKWKDTDLRKDRLALQRLKEAAEKCKCELSGSLKAAINLPFITTVDGKGEHLQIEITRSKFEMLTNHLTERTRGPVEQALKDAKIEAKDVNEVVLVGGSTRIPAVQELVKKLFNGKEPNMSVNPDEVVAAGAAVQGAVLAGDKKDIVLLDVTPLTLGIETKGGIMTSMIPRNTTIPHSKPQIFSTAEANQRAVDVKVYQGERKMTDGNRLLGFFQLDGIPPAQAGVPQVEVLFDIDANGILNVTAKDLGTKKQQSIKITSSSGLSKADVEKMKQDAEAHAAEDEKRSKLVEQRNEAEKIVWHTERGIREVTGLTAEQKKGLEDGVAKVKAAAAADDPAEIEKAIAALVAFQQKVAEEIYKKPTEGGAANGGGEAGGEGDKKEPIDAEFTVKD